MFSVVFSPVSIPFKREGVSKDGYWKHHIGTVNIGLVSIPFKREGVSQSSLTIARYRAITCVAIQWFQFPSNGKVYPKFQKASIAQE